MKGFSVWDEGSASGTGDCLELDSKFSNLNQINKDYQSDRKKWIQAHDVHRLDEVVTVRHPESNVIPTTIDASTRTHSKT